jgi:diguanylate cyclase (GGDEF)-like protein
MLQASRVLRSRGIRGQLTLWFGGLTLATLLCAGLYVGRIATGELVTSAGEVLAVRARSAADLLATNLRERQLEIELLRKTALFVQGDLQGPEVLEALEQRLQAHDEFAWLGVASPDGVVLQATQGILQGRQVEQRPWFKAARGGKAFTGDVHEAVMLAQLLPRQEGGQPLRFIDFSGPIHDREGRLRGVLGAHAHWSWVTRTVESVLGLEGAREVEVLIADRQGNVLYPEPAVGRLQLPARQQRGAPFETLRWSDGRDWLTAFAAVRSSAPEPLEWQIALRQPAPVALRLARALRDRLLLLGLLAAIVASALAYRFAARISRPIELLAASVREVAKGSRQPVYPSGAPAAEVEQLGDSIRSMTGALLQHERELESLNRSLEQQVAERTAELQRANDELERLATVDGLTAVANRRSLDQRLEAQFLLQRRSAQPYALALLDVDHFKRINDTHGHQAGDEVLRQLARLLVEKARATDFVARYGGEEFAVLLVGAREGPEAAVAAERIRAAVALHPFPEVGKVTVSIGLSSATARDAGAAEVVQRADAALYRAKQQGRDRVVAG